MNCIIVLLILYIIVFFCDASWIHKYVQYIKMFIWIIMHVAGQSERGKLKSTCVIWILFN